MTKIDAEPYQWPFDGNLTPENTCIIVIGEQSNSTFFVTYVCHPDCPLFTTNGTFLSSLLLSLISVIFV